MGSSIQFYFHGNWKRERAKRIRYVRYANWHRIDLYWFTIWIYSKWKTKFEPSVR